LLKEKQTNDLKKFFFHKKQTLIWERKKNKEKLEWLFIKNFGWTEVQVLFPVLHSFRLICWRKFKKKEDDATKVDLREFGKTSMKKRLENSRGSWFCGTVNIYLLLNDQCLNLIHLKQFWKELQ
jgi:hypothetical protein